MTRKFEARQFGHSQTGVWALPSVTLEEGMTRAFDVIMALAVLIFGAPVMLVVAMLIKLSDGGPVLFRQNRLGLDGRTFSILKFRSMHTDAEARLQDLLRTDPIAAAEWAREHKLRNDPRITPLGHFLRVSSFDELPQFLNVLFGEMSVVGPRPIVADEARRYGRRFRHYCTVNPGITGLWQVSGRNDTSYRRRVAMDVVYVRRKSFLYDLMLTLKTVPAVLLQRGSY